jgi:hypothetical protein
LDLSGLGRGLDGWKGIGIGDEISFWKESDKKGKFSKSLNKKWEKLKKINYQTITTLYLKENSNDTENENSTFNDKNLNSESSFKMKNLNQPDEMVICNKVHNIFLIHEYVVLPFILVWITLYIKNSIIWNQAVGNDSSYTT